MSFLPDCYKGSCPRCGGPLELHERVGALNADGSLSDEDTHDTLYCPNCKLWWLDEEATSDDLKRIEE